MDFEDELDLDTLADLLDDDVDGELLSIPTGSTLEPESSSTFEPESSSTFEPKKTHNSVINKTSKTMPEVKRSKYTPIDLFAQETNISPTQNECPKGSEVHTGLTDCSDEEEEKVFLTESGKTIKKRIALTPSYEEKRRPVKKIKTWKDNENPSNSSKESYVVDEYSGIRIINPLLPHGVMKNRMAGRRMIKTSFIRNFMKKGDIEGDWVTVGVIVNKVPPKTSKNGKTYSIWKLNDLNDTDNLVSLFLFSAVHTEHWKTPVGSVIGLLNASFLPDRDGNTKSSSISLSIDHPGKLMLIGTSKDFSHCKGRRKDGLSCTSIVNKSICEFCAFHVSKEYRKVSSKRTELQASYSGRQPSLKNKLLKGQNVIYGGQMFSSPTESVVSKSKLSKDKLRLDSLKFKRKAEEFAQQELGPASDRKPFEPPVAKPSNNSPFAAHSQFIKQQLSIPSAGSRQLSLYLSQADKKAKVEKSKKKITSITPKELLKLHEQQLKNKMKPQCKAASPLLASASPQLGRGFKPGEAISLDVRTPSCRSSLTPQDLAKFKAIKKVQANGSLKHKNPNAVKTIKSPDSFAKIQKSLEKNIETEANGEEKAEEKEEAKSLLGKIDINSEKFQEILNRKSSHQFEVEMEEIEKEAIYFRNLEKREQLEQKMASTMEIVCDVISCKKCKYTAHQASDLCKNEGHPLKAHKALKRFFRCTNCNRRTWAFTKLPKKACRNCGEFSFERTSMMKPRSGPKLESEILNIRGDEIKFLNSFVH